MRHLRKARRVGQRGAALLLAMVILTLVATLASGMVWQQWRAIQVESAERARTQASWLLTGALDWARLLLREDGRGLSGSSAKVDHLGEPWATPLGKTRMSTFLGTGDDSAGGIDAFLVGQIIDAQSRYNLSNLYTEVDAEGMVKEIEILKRLCEVIGLPVDIAPRIAIPLLRAAARRGEGGVPPGNMTSNDTEEDKLDSPIMPTTVDELVWLGIDPDVVRRLAPFVEILPGRTTVNLNTAGPEVLMAVLGGIDRSSAERIIQARRALSNGFESPLMALAQIPGGATIDAKHAGVNSIYFEVRGQLRYEETTVEQRSLVRREGTEVTIIRRERVRPESTP